MSSNSSPYSSSINSLTGVTKNFSESNGLVMNFAFTILVIIVFLILFQIGMNLIRYFYLGGNSPYLFNGMVDGKQYMSYEQNPSKENSITIKKSHNEKTGVEFTWSLWVYIEDLDYNKGKYRHIFHKGEANFDTTGPSEDELKMVGSIEHEPNIINSKDEFITTSGLNYPNNSPGLYISPNTNKLVMLINTFENILEKVEIDDIPMQKWFNVLIRCKNKTIDIYINGTLARRHILKSLPKQNYGNVYTGMNGGFDGYLSNMRYYDNAIETREIDKILTEGINLVNFSPRPTRNDKTNYLSTSWFGLN
jgi:hypothetical protein